MIEELKFRVYDKKKKQMFDVMCLYSNGQLEYRDGLAVVKLNKNDCNDFVVMQYTGFKDKNTKEIYEGDIVRCNDEYCAVVIWKRDGFLLDSITRKNIPSLWYNAENSEKIEVIGNIYENPELTILLSDDA